jgi:hypothetical protein
LQDVPFPDRFGLCPVRVIPGDPVGPGDPGIRGIPAIRVRVAESEAPDSEYTQH